MSSQLLLADVVWPALYFSSSYFTWWVVFAGLLIEFPVVRWSFDLPFQKAVLADILMNATSAFLGTVCLAIAGIVWEIFPGILFYKVFNLGTFNPITWSATFVLAVLINTGLEGLVLRVVFKCSLSRRPLMALAIANAVTVALAGLEMHWHPPTL